MFCFHDSVKLAISGAMMPRSRQENMFLLQRDSSFAVEKQLNTCPHGQGQWHHTGTLAHCVPGWMFLHF